jgi:NSS family neurotransmitter:Na+ symporter
MFAYGSYNEIKKPVIRDAIIICLIDFIFSLLAGFISWGAIGYLIKKDDTTALQTNSVGLAFIAFPRATSMPDDDQAAWFLLFIIFIIFTGIDTSMARMESFVTNIIDYTKYNRMLVVSGVGILGIIISIPFSSNYGWIIFDLVDHYIQSYVIIIICVLQCVAIGW